MSNQKEAIMKRYPEAVSAVDGVRVGDVICYNVIAKLHVVNEETIRDVLIAPELYYIIGNADRVAG